MPHRLEYLIDKPFTFEEDRALARAWAARLDRDGVDRDPLEHPVGIRGEGR
jgi:hypothetical protein